MIKSELNEIYNGHSEFDGTIWIKANTLIAKEISLDAAILFGVLFNIENYLLVKKKKVLLKNNLYFICKKKYVLDKINMCFSRQDRAIVDLEKYGLITTKLGQGKLKWFKINWNNYSKIKIDLYKKVIDTKIKEEEDLDEDF